MFLLLILSQALHSIEEYVSRLWEVLAPARFVSGLFTSDLALGFGIVNLSIVTFGLWCYFVPVRNAWQSARVFMWCWALLELANSMGHTIFAVSAGGYFPGLYTVPALFVCSTILMLRLVKTGAGSHMLSQGGK